MKMLHECRAKHVLWIIWDAEFDGGIHFKVWTEERSTSVQTRSNEVKCSNSFFYQKTSVLSSFISAFQKRTKISRITITNAKNFIKMWRRHLYLFFFCHCTAKNETFLWNLVCVLFVSSFKMYIPCLGDKFKIWDFTDIYFWKKKFWNLGVKIEKYWKFRITILKTIHFYVFRPFWIALCFKSAQSRSLQTFATFWPKIPEWRH